MFCTGSAPFSAVCSSSPCRHRKSRCKQLCQGWFVGTMLSNEKLMSRAFPSHNALWKASENPLQPSRVAKSWNCWMLPCRLEAEKSVLVAEVQQVRSKAIMLTYISTGMSTKSFSWIHRYKRQLQMWCTTQSIKFHGTEIKAIINQYWAILYTYVAWLHGCEFAFARLPLIRRHLVKRCGSRQRRAGTTTGWPGSCPLFYGNPRKQKLKRSLRSSNRRFAAALWKVVIPSSLSIEMFRGWRADLHRTSCSWTTARSRAFGKPQWWVLRMATRSVYVDNDDNVCLYFAANTINSFKIKGRIHQFFGCWLVFLILLGPPLEDFELGQDGLGRGDQWFGPCHPNPM